MQERTRNDGEGSTNGKEALFSPFFFVLFFQERERERETSLAAESEENSGQP